MNKRFIAVLGLSAAVVFFASVFLQAQAGGEVVLRAAAAKTLAGAWRVSPEPGASSGAALWLPDAGVPKLTPPSATPRDYFDLTFSARAGVPYRLWIRG